VNQVKKILINTLAFISMVILLANLFIMPANALSIVDFFRCRGINPPANCVEDGGTSPGSGTSHGSGTSSGGGTSSAGRTDTPFADSPDAGRSLLEPNPANFDFSPNLLEPGRPGRMVTKPPRGSKRSDAGSPDGGT
jgi:hypothetical protein